MSTGSREVIEHTLAFFLGCEILSPHHHHIKATGIEIDRAQLTADVLLALHHRINQWVDADPQLMVDYRAVSSSIGADVKVLLPGDEELLGTVRDVADDGRLVVVDKQGSEHVLAAGDVTHLRLQ